MSFHFVVERAARALSSLRQANRVMESFAERGASCGNFDSACIECRPRRPGAQRESEGALTSTASCSAMLFILLMRLPRKFDRCSRLFCMRAWQLMKEPKVRTAWAEVQDVCIEHSERERERERETEIEKTRERERELSKYRNKEVMNQSKNTAKNERVIKRKKQQKTGNNKEDNIRRKKERNKEEI